MSNKIPVPIDYKSDRIFSTVIKNVSRGDSLLLEWKINWANLAAWQGCYDSSGDGNKLKNIIPTIQGDVYDEYRMQINNLREEFEQVITTGRPIFLNFSQKLLNYIMKLTKERQSRDVIGDVSAASLARRAINLASTVSNYQEADELGTDTDDFYKKTLFIMKKIIEEFDDIAKKIETK